MSYKFDEASYKDNNDNLIEPPLKLEYLIEEKSKNEKLFENKYYQRLFCPECHAPQLSLVPSKNDTDFFLRGYPKQVHINNCSYSFDPVSKRAITELINSPDSREFINAKLNGLINSLLRRNVLQQNPFLVKMEHNHISTDDIEERNFRNPQTIRRLPTKSLTSPFDEEDYNTPKFFYGNVDIAFYKRENKNTNAPFYNLTIYAKGTKNMICSITMSETVFSYLQIPKHLKDTEVIHNNVVIATSTTLFKKGIFVNGSINYSDYCVIDEL